MYHLFIVSELDDFTYQRFGRAHEVEQWLNDNGYDPDYKEFHIIKGDEVYPERTTSWRMYE